MTPEMINEFIELMPFEALTNKDGDTWAYVTPPARLAFSHFATPNDDGKLTGVLMFPQGAELGGMRDAILAAGAEKFGQARLDKLLKDRDITLPLKSAETDSKKIEKEYEGFDVAQAWLSVSNIAEKVAMDFVNANMEPCDAKEFYSGCWVRARVSFRGSDYKRNSVTAYVSALQFIGDDGEFKSAGEAGAGFGALPASMQAKKVASLGEKSPAKTGASYF